MVVLESFGFKHRRPSGSANFVIDCRSLWNPHNDKRLRPLTGLDPEVRGAMTSRGDFRTFLVHLRALLKTGTHDTVTDPSKPDVLIQFGCTGGRHRSVVCVEEMAVEFRKLTPDVKVRHLELAPVHTMPEEEPEDQKAPEPIPVTASQRDEDV